MTLEAITSAVMSLPPADRAKLVALLTGGAEGEN
jgi:hypothetical protein